MVSNNINEDGKEINKGSLTKEYKTDDIIVYWTPSLCAHSKNCIHGSPEVFDLEKRPWINMKMAVSEQIIKTIDKCPTGALKYKLTVNSNVDKVLAQGSGSVDYRSSQPSTVEIELVKNGPIIVKGQSRLVDSEGTLMMEGDQMALCRCGLSKNYPFCDGSHAKK